MPSQVILLDESDFLRPNPTLDLLLACECLGSRIMRFVKYKLIYGITFREAIDFFGFMLLHSLLEVPRHACVERTRSVCEDVDCVRFHGIWPSIQGDALSPSPSLLIKVVKILRCAQEDGPGEAPSPLQRLPERSEELALYQGGVPTPDLNLLGKVG